jgi:DNA repair protein RecO (recombination protein O)
MERTEGVILTTLNFQEYDQILKVFTPEQGVVKFIFKRALSHKGRQGAVLAPLSRAEFHYIKGKGEFNKCREVCMLNPHLSLRQELAWLQTGCEMLQIILQSQVEQKSAPALYKLLISYLEKIPLMTDPQVLVSSLRLKILRHDGLYRIGAVCDQCEQPLKGFSAIGGETFCKSHAPSHCVEFCDEETDLLEHLAFCQTFTQLKGITVPAHVNHKVKHFFNDLVC